MLFKLIDFVLRIVLASLESLEKQECSFSPNKRLLSALCGLFKFIAHLDNILQIDEIGSIIGHCSGLL